MSEFNVVMSPRDGKYATVEECQRMIFQRADFEGQMCVRCQYFEHHDMAIYHGSSMGDLSVEHIEMNGSCRRYPPTHYVEELDKMIFPVLAFTEWCGEFRSHQTPPTMEDVCAFPEQEANQLG